MNPKRLITVIVLLFSNTLISQNNDNNVREIYLEKYDKTITITYQDYVRYVYGKDRDMIANFASSRNQFLVKITPGNSSSLSEFRKYVVTYLDAITQKQFVGYYDGNQHNWGSFERFVKDETRITINDIEDEKRRVIVQKKFEKEEKERKRLAKIEEQKRERRDFRKEMVKDFKGYNGKTNIDNDYLNVFFFGDWKHQMRKRNYIQDYMEFDFEINKKFIENGDLSSDSIEEIGSIILKWKDDEKGVFFKITIGVNNLFDENKFKYFVDGKETDFDFGLRNRVWRNPQFDKKNEWGDEKTLKKIGKGFLKFRNKINNPFVYSNYNFDLQEFLIEFKNGELYTKEEEIEVYKRNSYKGIGRNIINGFIKKELSTYLEGDKWFSVRCEITEVKDKKSKLEWKLEIYRGYDLLNSSKFKFDKKDLVVEEKSTFGTDIYKGSRVEKMLKGDYEYSDVMNN